MIDLGRVIEDANQLAPLPASAVRLAEIIGGGDCHLEDVAEVISFDQALTIRLLRAANSAASAGVLPVATAREAVTRLGTAQVLALAVACGAKPLLQQRVPAYELDEGALWRHSVAAAVAAEVAPNFCPVAVPAESFTAALLHDVGKLLMGRFLSDEILLYIRLGLEQDHLSQLEAESTLLGVNHAELGGLVAQHWHLPESIVHGIIFHHDPEQGQDVMSDLTYLANQAAKQIEAGPDGRPWEMPLLPGVATRLGLTRKALDRFGPAVAGRFAQVQRRYNAI